MCYLADRVQTLLGTFGEYLQGFLRVIWFATVAVAVAVEIYHNFVLFFIKGLLAAPAQIKSITIKIMWLFQYWRNFADSILSTFIRVDETEKNIRGYVIITFCIACISLYV